MSPATKKKSVRKAGKKVRKPSGGVSSAGWVSLLIWPLAMVLCLVYAAGVESRRLADRQNREFHRQKEELEQEQAELQLQVELLERQLELMQEKPAASGQR